MASWFEQTPLINYKKNRVNKPKSFDESIFIPKNSPTSFATNYGYYSYTYTKEKKLHPVFPLPLPLDSPNFSTRSSCGSSPTSSQLNDDEEQGISPLFSPLRNKCNDWSRTSNESSKSTSPCTSPTTYPVEWDKKLDSPNGKQEKCNHPRHPLPLPLPPNSSINNRTRQWKKGKLLAKGTFGNVYAGFNSDNGQMCAIKEVRIIFNDTTSKERLKQLNQEITLLSQISHPNIVQYYGSESRGDKLSLYLEYVPGGSILKLLQEYGPFEEQIIKSYTRKILSGLVFLHERNIAHRDIKGANILVNAKGEIKLADFGMAKHINSCCLMDSFKGSPYWMAPEQVVKDAGGSSVAVDIWSLGCTIVEMATAKRPYEGATAALFKQADGKDSPEIPRNLSDDAKSFLKLCLQRNPSRRLTAVQLLHHPFLQA
ncbi:mitogen-activated protein kinase kinase kinase 3-like isoform X1 [Solanum lycopersicum]|uniref:mitogen-activated protein kinase kinase kinase 3-like isoform X1 n=1 Tax=Solanum lycopersicum TaxID=4081 RepID=UPI000532B693|nr:mitogen-activated protein kinase kinase kinase 3-like isoform X1 [Solanum lycopersicum]XP_010320023.1 mitogen-activated protein kinase kinase kinase 3-like isoform X1 [Solanum lycopersicum]